MPKRSKNQIQKQESLKAARLAKIQKEAPRKVEQGRDVRNLDACAVVFLEGIIKILLSRAEALSTGTELPDSSRAQVACHHAATIGSSQLHKLGQKSFNIRTLHQRVAFAGARSVGAYWEEQWATQTSFVCEGISYDIIRHKHEPFHYSHQLPWVGATPDFVALLQHKDQTPFWAVIEVKSHTNGAPTMPRYLHQVQVALDCFNIQKGFLVVYDAREEADQQPVIRAVERSHLLSNTKIALHEKYCGFLQRCVSLLFKTDLPLEFIRTKLAPLLEIEIAPFHFCWENLSKGVVRKGCYYSSIHRRLGRTRKRYSRYALKPNGLPHVLCDPFETQAPMDEDGNVVRPN